MQRSETDASVLQGYDSVFWAARGFDVEATDVSETAVKAAQQVRRFLVFRLS